MSGDGAPAITVRRPTLIEGLSDDEERHMPSFNSPSPSPDLPPAEHSPSGGQYRPKLETNVSQSHSPLLGDISAAATPTSPLDNPFDSYRMGGTSPSVSPAPIEGAGPPPMSSTSSSPPHEYEDYAEGPFRNHASGSSSSGGSHDAEKVAAAAATATGNNRASLAPTEKSTATSTGRAAPMTAAERRLQRMSKITNRSKNSRQSARPAGQQMSRKAFQSTRLKEEIYKPWLEKKDPAMRWARWITIGSIILGVAIMGVCEFAFAAGMAIVELQGMCRRRWRELGCREGKRGQGDRRAVHHGQRADEQCAGTATIPSPSLATCTSTSLCLSRCLWNQC